MPEDSGAYQPFLIDPMPCMSFKVFYYDKEGYLQRPWFYYHSLRDPIVRESRHGVTLSFSSDSRVVTLRGGMSLHTAAEAMADCRLSTINVYDKRVWAEVSPEIELIDRILITELRDPRGRRPETFDAADFEDAPLPGERPLKG